MIVKYFFQFRGIKDNLEIFIVFSIQGPVHYFLLSISYIYLLILQENNGPIKQFFLYN